MPTVVSRLYRPDLLFLEWRAGTPVFRLDRDRDKSIGSQPCRRSLPLWLWTDWLCSPTIIWVDSPLQRFGANVRQARLDRGWTQEHLAFETGLATVQVSRIERGVREIRLTTLVRLIDGLDVPADELLDGLLGQG